MTFFACISSSVITQTGKWGKLSLVLIKIQVKMVVPFYIEK